MTAAQVEELIKRLKDKNVIFEKGLSDDELQNVELTFDVKFPPDLKMFLQRALPVSGSFVNWRLGCKSDEEREKINSRLIWPLDGMLFDIQNNVFWNKEWGNPPATYEEKARIAEQHYSHYPKLIPIYSHRYIANRPSEEDNPVFSVYHMDIIYYGYNLAHYLAHEFKFPLSWRFWSLRKKYKEIEFWSEAVRINNE